MAYFFAYVYFLEYFLHVPCTFQKQNQSTPAWHNLNYVYIRRWKCVLSYAIAAIKISAWSQPPNKYIHTVTILIAATLYLAAARHDFCAPAKFEIWHSYIWQRQTSTPAPEKATQNKQKRNCRCNKNKNKANVN